MWGESMLARLALLLGLLGCSTVFRATPAQNPPPKTQNPPPPQAESFWRKVLRVSGIAASPSTLKGPGDEVQQGQVWVVEVHSGQPPRGLTPQGGYRSPVFLPGGTAILALRGSNVIRVSLADGSPTTLFPVTGLAKLVGFSMDDSNALLVLTRDASSHSAPAFLDVRSGKLTSVPYDPSSTDDRHMLEHLSAWERSYGDTLLYVSQQTKSGMAGTLSWTDVFLKQSGQPPLDISKCDGTNCGQPSLSSDGRLVAFIRSDAD